MAPPPAAAAGGRFEETSAMTETSPPLETSRISVPAESEQATIVRQFVRLACHRYGCDRETDAILQVADELVAQAVEHGPHPPGDTVEVGIVPTQRGVRIEVSDHVPPRPDDTLHQPGEAPSMHIVSVLATAWGVEDAQNGTTVWAEVTRAGSDADDAHA
jgi:anti-sigma regulatory factor (Ser/Thr protein kinase)